MASRGGPRAAGTDGGDFGHREVIKEQYYVRNGGGGRGGGFVNDDPGVHDSEEDEDYLQQLRGSNASAGGGTVAYADSQAVMEEIARKAKELSQMEQPAVGTAAGPSRSAAAAADDLPLSGDYHGLGGPDSVPLYAGEGIPFEPPLQQGSTTKKQCLLDELFLAPSQKQIRAFDRIERKNRIAKNKSRLKWCVTSHLLLFLLVLAKIVPEILDRMDIFVLQLEELYIPKAALWEWLWLALSLPLCLLAASACRRSTVSSMTNFMRGVIVLLVLVLIGLGIHFGDVYAYLTKGKDALEDMPVWKGFPVSVLWYAFFLAAVQVHFFELYFAKVLVQAWAPKRKAH